MGSASFVGSSSPSPPRKLIFCWMGSKADFGRNEDGFDAFVDEIPNKDASASDAAYAKQMMMAQRLNEGIILRFDA